MSLDWLASIFIAYSNVYLFGKMALLRRSSPSHFLSILVSFVFSLEVMIFLFIITRS